MRDRQRQLPERFPPEIEILMGRAEHRGKPQLRAAYSHGGKDYTLVVNFNRSRDPKKRVEELDRRLCCIRPDGQLDSLIFCSFVSASGEAIAKRDFSDHPQNEKSAEAVRDSICEHARFREVLALWI